LNITLNEVYATHALLEKHSEELVGPVCCAYVNTVLTCL
jgi:hypothetical protein